MKSLRRWNLAMAAVVTFSGTSLSADAAPARFFVCSESCGDDCNYTCEVNCTKKCTNTTCYDNESNPRPYTAVCEAAT